MDCLRLAFARHDPWFAGKLRAPNEDSPHYGEDYHGGRSATIGSVSSSARTAQLVAANEMNCDLPPWSPLSKNFCSGLLRVSTNQAPSSSWESIKYLTPF